MQDKFSAAPEAHKVALNVLSQEDVGNANIVFNE